jgi:hypothetical protein
MGQDMDKTHGAGIAPITERTVAPKRMPRSGGPGRGQKETRMSGAGDPFHSQSIGLFRRRHRVTGQQFPITSTSASQIAITEEAGQISCAMRPGLSYVARRLRLSLCLKLSRRLIRTYRERKVKCLPSRPQNYVLGGRSEGRRSHQKAVASAFCRRIQTIQAG